MYNIRIAKAMTKFPIAPDGSLAIPPHEQPLFMRLARVERFLTVVPRDQNEFLTMWRKAYNILPNNMPVEVALGADSIYFWSRCLDTISGRLKQSTGKIAIDRLGLVLDNSATTSRRVPTIDYFNAYFAGVYGFTIYYKAELKAAYRVSAPDKDYIVNFASELLRRSGIDQFDWDADYQIGDVQLI